MIPLTTKAGGTCFAFPDVCLVPASPNPIPTPFPNRGACADAQGTVDSVRVEGADVLIETSTLPTSTGDEAGTGGGVVSGTFGGCVKFKTASATVRAKGKRVILATALTAHNGSNANMPVGQQIVASQTKVFAGS